MKVFHSFDTMDWGRISLIVAAITTFWAGMISVIPEKYHHVGLVFLSSITSAITLMMRSGKSRIEKIEDKVEEYEAEGIKKSEEIQQLITNEVKEKSEKK